MCVLKLFAYFNRNLLNRQFCLSKHARNAQIFGGHGLNGLFLGNIVDVHGDSGSAKTELMMNVVAIFWCFGDTRRHHYSVHKLRTSIHFYNKTTYTDI